MLFAKYIKNSTMHFGNYSNLKSNRKVINIGNMFRNASGIGDTICPISYNVERHVS